MTRTSVPAIGFFYNDSIHKYYLNGIQMTGITTILGVAGDKSNLIQWAANQAAAAAILEAASIDITAFAAQLRSYPKLDTTAAKELERTFPGFGTARTASNRIRDNAADTGTAAHSLCERFERGEALNQADEVPAVWERAQLYLKWYEENIESTYFVERPLFSSSHFIGGTPDGGFRTKDGQNLINDKKFKPYIYDPSPFWQMAAYRLMLEEMAADDTTPVRIEWKDGTVEEYASPKEYLGSFGGVAWDGSVVVRVGERRGDLEAMYCNTYEDDKSGFLAALTLYRQIGAFKSRVLIAE